MTRSLIALVCLLSGIASAYACVAPAAKVAQANPYEQLARASGGQVWHTSPDESAETLAHLMTPSMKKNAQLVLQLSGELTGQPFVFVCALPIDDQLGQATWIVQLPQRQSIVLKRPDGSVVEEGERGVKLSNFSGGRIYTVQSPGPGTWSIEVQGSGALSIEVSGTTRLFPYSFEFVKMGGRPGHEGLFPIEGALAPGSLQTARSIILGEYASASFEFRSREGELISRPKLALKHPMAGDDYEWVGKTLIPVQAFQVYVTGVTKSGYAFQRRYQSEFLYGKPSK